MEQGRESSSSSDGEDDPYAGYVAVGEADGPGHGDEGDANHARRSAEDVELGPDGALQERMARLLPRGTPQHALADPLPEHTVTSWTTGSFTDRFHEIDFAAVRAAAANIKLGKRPQ